MTQGIDRIRRENTTNKDILVNNIRERMEFNHLRTNVLRERGISSSASVVDLVEKNQ
jgi:hypothetical protein